MVVIGGGFAGATCARFLKRIDPRITVTLVEASQTFTACPFSNDVIAGLRDLKAQQFGYDKFAGDGVTVAFATATAVDPQARSVTLSNGARLDYDRLVLAPGIDIRWDGLPGYNEAAAERMPHAWKAGEQTLLLRRQLDAMAGRRHWWCISAPANPFRCPPGPYERASLIAYYLKTKKPKSKLIVLDAKDAFSKQRLFQNAWKELYPNLEWVSLSKGGKVTSVDVGAMTLVTDFGRHKADVANVIPPQKAGRIAEVAGVADRSGWCPIDPVTFEFKLQPNIHVDRRRHDRGRHAEIGVLGECPGQGLRGRGGEAPRRRQARRAEADQHLLQPCGARLWHLGCRRLSRRTMASSRMSRAPAASARPSAPASFRAHGSEVRQWLVQDHHREVFG